MLRHLSVLFLLASAASAQILPKSFSGWQQATSKPLDVKTVSAENADALKEYGFKDAEQATYGRDGRTVTLTALRFVDGTGGFGAFTWLREPGFVKEQLCNAGASAREHIVFYCADIVIDARWDRITAMTMADLRALAESLPKLTGPAANIPNVPPTLRASDDLKLALGPAAYKRFQSLPGWAELVPPAESIDFNRNAEVMLAPVAAGRGIVTVVRYPNPAIARQQLTAWEKWSKTPAENLYAQVKRSGPILAAVKGQIDVNEAQRALDSINYEADVTWNESTGLEKRNNIGGLVYAAVLLAIIIFGIAVVGGIFFGGFRLLLSKAFPKRFGEEHKEAEFIRLNIR